MPALLEKVAIAVAGIVLAFVLGRCQGIEAERADWRARVVQSNQVTKKAEQDIQTEVANDDRNLDENLGRGEARAKLQIALLEQALKRQQARRDCPVHPDVVRMYVGAAAELSAAPRAGADAAQAGQTVDPARADDGVAKAVVGGELVTVDAADLIHNGAVNRQLVCEPNAQQLDSVLETYEDVRERYNAAAARVNETMRR